MKVEPGNDDILKLLDISIKQHREVQPNPFFYTRVMQRLGNANASTDSNILQDIISLIRPLPVAVLIFCGIILGFMMVHLSGWATIRQAQDSIAANDEIYNVLYQGESDQSVYESYFSSENSTGNE